MKPAPNARIHIIFIYLTRTPSSGLWLASQTLEFLPMIRRIEQALNYLLFAWQIKIFAIFAMLKKHAQGTKCGIVK